MKADTPDITVTPILGALIVTALPYAPQLPPAVLAWCAAAGGYVYLASRCRWPLPGRFLLATLAVSGMLLVLITGTAALSHSTGTTLLIMATTMKLMEMRSKRDQMVTIFLIYFLTVTGLLVSHSLTTTIYMAFSIFMTTTVLIHLHAPRQPLGIKLGLSGKLMLQALPLTAMLFFVFPRIQAGLWGVTGSDTGVSGLGTELKPGAVSRLILNRDIAFRAEFYSRLPDRQDLYWRGVVFWDFDGSTWQQGEHAFPIHLPLAASSSIDYTITLEPHRRRWLFALDLPQDSTAGWIQSDYTLVAPQPVAQRLRYRVTSAPANNTGALRNAESAALNIPADTNPQAVELARAWRASSQSPRQIVEQALAYLREQGFVYTLNPPRLGSHPVDDFLFSSRRGYCEHYASAFVFLMRAAGLPARLVAGYQGGEMNPYGQYLIVRQSDAHVWVEVWLAGRGWVRVDPTAAVAPDRISFGMAAALPLQERSTLSSFSERGMIGRVFKPIQLGWDALNNQWNTWILGYSHQRQKILLARLRLADGRWQHIGLALALSLGGVALVVFFMRRRMTAPLSKRTDAVLKSFDLFSAKLRKLDLVRRPAEGPQALLGRIAAQHPAMQDQAEKIIRLYILLRYGRGGTGEDIKKFQRLVKQFDPSEFFQPDSRK